MAALLDSSRAAQGRLRKEAKLRRASEAAQIELEAKYWQLLDRHAFIDLCAAAVKLSCCKLVL